MSQFREKLVTNERTDRRTDSTHFIGPSGNAIEILNGYFGLRKPPVYISNSQHLQEYVNAGQVPTWITEGRTVLIMKDKSKGTVVGNYRPIACLPLMWKLLTIIFSEAMYGHLSSQELLSNEQSDPEELSKKTY